VIRPGVLAAIQKGILDKCQIDVAYQSAAGQEGKALTLHPLALIQAGAVTYLAATAYDYRDVRLYALHRFQSVENTSAAAKRPTGFSIEQLLDRGGIFFGSGRSIRIEAEITERLALTLRETPLSSDMALSPIRDGHCKLKASVRDTWQLHFWILSQGADITVRQPGSLRRQIAEILRTALARYN
jgi:predicted DNA-binding transcriptional regulator YafY